MTSETKVFLDYDQEALDNAYDQSVYAPNSAQIGRRRVLLSAETRRRLGEPMRVTYGPTDIEGIDIYRTHRMGAPVVVFVHGGAWRAGKARDVAYPAELFVSAGAHYAVLDFTSVEEAGGSLLPMADQVRRAVAWLYQNAESFGGNSKRICLIGHSSGAHLGGCVMVTDWQAEFGLPADIVKSAVLSSGMYDLYPVSLSKRSRYVAFTPAIIEALSSQRHLDLLNAPLVVAYGTLETPEFQRQTRDFADAVSAAGKGVELIVGEELNHFEMLETLASPFGLLGRAALKLFDLSFS
jgi:arylformamidase